MKGKIDKSEFDEDLNHLEEKLVRLEEQIAGLHEKMMLYVKDLESLAKTSVSEMQVVHVAAACFNAAIPNVTAGYLKGMHEVLNSVENFVTSFTNHQTDLTEKIENTICVVTEFQARISQLEEMLEDSELEEDSENDGFEGSPNKRFRKEDSEDEGFADCLPG